MTNLTLDQFNRAIGVVNQVFGHQYYWNKDKTQQCKVGWFLCFGNLLHIIRMQSALVGKKLDESGIKAVAAQYIEKDHDIDIGCYEELLDGDQIKRGFQCFGYKPTKAIRNNADGRYLYMSFENTEPKHYPIVDVFMWKKYKDLRFHTYDFHHTGKEMPPEYVFKGVKANWLNELICWQFQWNTHEIWVPLKYGTLLDCWYPHWLKPREGQSESPWMVRTPSCKNFNDDVFMHDQMEKSKQDYDVFLKRL